MLTLKQSQNKNGFPYKFDEHSQKSARRAEAGDYIICKSENLKNYIKGGIYKVKSAKSKGFYGWGNDTLQLEGFPGTVHADKFEIIEDSLILQKLRLMKLSVIMGKPLETIKLETEKIETRKIESVDDKKYKLIELVLNRIVRDKNNFFPKQTNPAYSYRNFTEMVELIVKGDKIYQLEKIDFDLIKNLTVDDFFSYFIEYRQKNGF